MKENDFRTWLESNGKSKKIISDTISRLRRVEKEFSCNIDNEYKKDQCSYLLSIFVNKGENENMKKYESSNFPVGKYTLAVYPYAIRIYKKFLEGSIK